MTSTTGQRIAQLREKYVLGQAELARAAGLSPGALWEIERDRRVPRPATLRKLAAAMSELSGHTVEAAELRGESDGRE